MKHVVKLRFFEDEANGEWGLAHDETFNDSNNPFNAFWNGRGMFHDVFEHWHEYKHKYFKGEAALNVGGEMAAMGAYYYFIEYLGVHNRNFGNSWRSNGDNMRQTTESEILESITQGYTRYGDTLISEVPNQRPVESSELDYQCEVMYENAMKAELPKENEDGTEYATAKAYKDSVKLSKIKNLHRFGFRMAERLFPDNRDNQNTLTDFIDFWDEFTKKNNAEELANIFTGITFTITKKAGVISWKAVLEPMYGSDVKPYIIKQGDKVYYVQDELYEYEDED